MGRLRDLCRSTTLTCKVSFMINSFSLGTLGNAFAFPRAGNPSGFPSMKHLSFF